MRVWSVILLAVGVLVGCGGAPSPTPDLVGTQIAVEEAAHATMTARAPTATDTPAPTNTFAPTATSTVTPRPTDTNTPTFTPTPIPSPTYTATEAATAPWTPSPEPSRTPKPAPTKKPTAKPQPVVESPPLSTYRVYYSAFRGSTTAEEQNSDNYSVWSMRGDGQEAGMLVSQAQQPALSVDGTKLAYVHLGSGIVVYDLATGQGREDINYSGAESPSFSPMATGLPLPSTP